MKKLYSFVLFSSIIANTLAQSLCFDPNSDVRYEAGNGPYGVAAGDFDEDNDLDAVSANYLSGSVSIFIGNGDGTFQEQIEIGNFSGSSEDVAVGDFNNDQHDDILVCLRGNSSNLALITGNGDGTFNPADFFYLGLNGNQFREIELADVDNDNILDVVYNVMEDSTVYMIKTVGDGTFTLLDSVVTSGKSWDVSLGDINGDTYPDLAVSYQVDALYVSYYLGNGDGSFGSENTLPLLYAGPYANCVFAQLDNDSHFDLVAESNTFMYVWRSDGTGGFTQEASFPFGAQPNQLFAGNFDNTGNADIAWAEGSSGTIGSRTDTADFALDISSRNSAYGDAQSGVLGDFNNDGELDMVAGCFNNDYITFLIGNGDGTFGPLELRTYGFPEAIAAADFDGDQHVDIITANAHSSVWMSFMKGNGDGSFNPTVNHSILTGIQDLQAINVDGDGDLDIAIVTNSGHLLIEHNDGAANFSDEDVYNTNGGGGNRALTVGDFNNDQLPDLAFCYANNDEFNVFLNTGTDAFSAPSNFGTGTYPQDIFAADLNGDDFDDLITANDQSNDISVHINNHVGGFDTQVDYPTGAGCRGITIADFNNDQELDIATVNNNSVNISILLGNGDGTFQAAQNVPLAASSSPVQIIHGLVNGDNELDLVVSYAQFNQVALLTGNGNGTFNSPLSFSTDDSPDALSLADFNEDNALDIAVTNYNTQNVSVILNNSALIDVSGSTQLCEGEDVTLTATGGFSYLWSTGETTPSITVDETGSYTVTITNQAGDCSIIPPGVSVTVNTAPNVNLSNINQGDQCISDDFLSLTGGQPQGGNYSGITVVNGVFNPSLAGAGTHTLYYTYTDPAGCFTLTDSAEYVVHPQVGATNNFPFQALCLGSDPIDLSNLGTPSGGSWIVDFAAITEFDPVVHGLGSHELLYIAENAACIDTSTVSVDVITAVTAALSFSIDSVCADHGLLTLAGGSPTGGSYFGNGVSNNMFNPTTAGVGTTNIGYGYDAGAGCADTAYANMEVLESATAMLTASQYYFCIDDYIVIIQLSGQPSGGQYFGSGVVGNEFDPAEAGEGIHEVGYAYENTSGCSDTAFVEIQIELCPGIREIDSQAMELYPNPASGLINVTMRDYVSNGKLEIRNLLGQVLYSKSIRGEKTIQINTELANGNYLLVLRSEDIIGVERLTVIK